MCGVVFLSNTMGSVEYAITAHDSAVYLKRGETSGGSSRQQLRGCFTAWLAGQQVAAQLTCPQADSQPVLLLSGTGACAGFTTRRVASSLTGFVQHLLA